MYNYLSVFAFSIMLLTAPKVYAHQMSLQLAPNGSRVMTNHFGWTFNATCIIKTRTKSKNKIRLSVQDNKGSVNGKNLAVGQATSMDVQNQDSISVSAEPGTRITLQNLSNDPVQATCST
jgi:thioredoxin reductase